MVSDNIQLKADERIDERFTFGSDLMKTDDKDLDLNVTLTNQRIILRDKKSLSLKGEIPLSEIRKVEFGKESNLRPVGYMAVGIVSWWAYYGNIDWWRRLFYASAKSGNTFTSILSYIIPLLCWLFLLGSASFLFMFVIHKLNPKSKGIRIVTKSRKTFKFAGDIHELNRFHSKVNRFVKT